jgi:photosystem II stability/assembly factor-like uncharacterized protein
MNFSESPISINSTTPRILKFALSYDGSYQTVFCIDNSQNYHIMYSSNKGASWNVSNYLGGITLLEINNIKFGGKCKPGYRASDLECYNILISDDGKVQMINIWKYAANNEEQNLCGVYSYLLISSNYGASWSLSQLPTNLAFFTISMSSTGKYQNVSTFSRLVLMDQVVFSNDTAQNGIYYSQDYGNTWKQSSALSTVSYVSTCMTYDGSIQKAVSTDGFIYTSTDFGKSWVKGNNCFTYELNFFGKQLFLICISGHTGQYQFLVQPEGYIFVSNDYGNTWYSKISIVRSRYDRPFFICSNTGQDQLFYTSGSMYVSSDYGNTWENKFVYLTNKSWTVSSTSISSTTDSVGTTYSGIREICISKSLRYLLVRTYNNLLYSENSVIGTGPFRNSVNTNISNTNLTYSKISNNIKNIAYVVTSSDMNIKIISSPSFISKIEGSKLSNPYQFQIIDRSDPYFLTITYLGSTSDCSIFLGCGEILNVSTKTSSFHVLASIDGIKWGALFQSNYQYSGIVASDSQSKKVIAISKMNIISFTFTTNGSPLSIDATRITNYKSPSQSKGFIGLQFQPEMLTSLCISPDGTKQAIITNFGSLFISKSPGIWTVFQNFPFCNSQILPLGQNNQIAIDNSGQYISVCQENVGIFVSSDGGTNFTSVNIPIASWKSIKISSTGKYQIAVSTTSGMYMSINFGETWTGTNIPYEMFIGCTISSSGQDFTVVSSDAVTLSRTLPPEKSASVVPKEAAALITSAYSVIATLLLPSTLIRTSRV